MPEKYHNGLTWVEKPAPGIKPNNPPQNDSANTTTPADSGSSPRKSGKGTKR